MAKAEELNAATIVLPKGILQQDMEIIDEQESHIVLTLRVPIDWIRKNHAMLMALSEIVKSRPLVEPEGDLAEEG